MRVVADTNVLASAFAFGGICRAILDVCLNGHELFISEYILNELHRVLIDKLNHTETQAVERVALLRDACSIVIPSDISHDICRDVDDLPVIGTLVASNADFLVTGDKDLLELRHIGTGRIVSPREFWSTLRLQTR